MVDAKDTIAPKPPMHFADGIKKDSVVFISQPKNMYSACWGGLMSTRAKYLGAQGVIIDGNFRDVNEYRDLNFPLFAKGSSTLGSASFTRSSTLNQPVQFTSDVQEEPFTITPGDLILADADCVVVIPPTLVEQCLIVQEEPFTITPGDLILADADGVVVIPPTLVEQCLILCEERWDIDEKTRKCLENGDEMGPTINKLRK
ncbi:hypothetical protein V498_05237 [Pseudogymnoascus sp. VKM F-4517 (FW-2822)]|nr:hypothetical protein V498_05237 [Pseudogymnoascus sp. VKM F-4517 (FW-2822)]